MTPWKNIIFIVTSQNHKNRAIKISGMNIFGFGLIFSVYGKKDGVLQDAQFKISF